MNFDDFLKGGVFTLADGSIGNWIVVCDKTEEELHQELVNERLEKLAEI